MNWTNVRSVATGAISGGVSIRTKKPCPSMRGSSLLTVASNVVIHTWDIRSSGELQHDGGA